METFLEEEAQLVSQGTFPGPILQHHPMFAPCDL